MSKKKENPFFHKAIAAAKPLSESGQTPLFGGEAEFFGSVPVAHSTSKPAKTKGKSWGYSGPKCYESHPVLELGGGKIVAGSCHYPMTKTADAYIGLDGGMMVLPMAPWDGDNRPQVLYKITDHTAPKDLESFQKMLDWITGMLKEGKTVHIGCIGGHGRTGTVLAALYAQINGDTDAITTVRKLYCKQAVESDEQVQFLKKHFGVKVVGGSKPYVGMAGVKSGWWGTSKEPKVGSKELKGSPAVSFKGGDQPEYRSVPSAMAIWGKII